MISNKTAEFKMSILNFFLLHVNNIQQQFEIVIHSIHVFIISLWLFKSEALILKTKNLFSDLLFLLL